MRLSVSLMAMSLALAAVGAVAAEPPASRDAMPAVTPSTTKPVPPVITVDDRANAAKAAKPATASAQPARRPGSDRLDLDTTVVTGNRELPKVLYIVPWKRSELGDMPQQPMNTLLDEVLTPVDRDVFRREVTYYGAMSAPDGAADALPVPPAAASEK